MKNLREQKNVKLVITERGRNYLVLKPNYRTTKWSWKKLISNSALLKVIIMLHGNRQLSSLYKSKTCLRRNGKRHWNKVDTSNYELGRPLPRRKSNVDKCINGG